MYLVLLENSKIQLINVLFQTRFATTENVPTFIRHVDIRKNIIILLRIVVFIFFHKLIYAIHIVRGRSSIT